MALHPETLKGDVDTDKQFLIFKGFTYQLSPLNITISLLIISHNIIIIVDYYKDRAKLVPSLFMGIALADVLYAQGLLVVSVMSILVFNGVVSEQFLYRSLYYYMATGLPGYSCSRLFYVALSLTLTMHLDDPFRRLNSARLKRAVLFLAVIFTVLHLLDVMFCVVADFKYHLQDIVNVAFVWLVIWCDIPGFVTAFAIYCLPSDGMLMDSRCFGEDFPRKSSFPLGLSLFFLNFVLAPLIVLICMILQVFHLRKKRDPDMLSSLTNTSRRASVTIMMTSLIFFVCHTAYLSLMIVFGILYGYESFPDNISDLHVGNALGFVEGTAPLINALR